jgi:hypothetical protein
VKKEFAPIYIDIIFSVALDRLRNVHRSGR